MAQLNCASSCVLSSQAPKQAHKNRPAVAWLYTPPGPPRTTSQQIKASPWRVISRRVPGSSPALRLSSFCLLSYLFSSMYVFMSRSLSIEPASGPFITLTHRFSGPSVIDFQNSGDKPHIPTHLNIYLYIDFYIQTVKPE